MKQRGFANDQKGNVSIFKCKNVLTNNTANSQQQQVNPLVLESSSLPFAPSVFPAIKILYYCASLIAYHNPMECHDIGLFTLEYSSFSNKIINILTHYGLVTPYGDIDLGQHWLR